MLLTVNATSGATWCCWCLCKKITEKVSSVTIVLRKYQASQMPSSKEPHLAREPDWFPTAAMSACVQLPLHSRFKHISLVLTKQRAWADI